MEDAVSVQVENISDFIDILTRDNLEDILPRGFIVSLAEPPFRIVFASKKALSIVDCQSLHELNSFCDGTLEGIIPEHTRANKVPKTIRNGRAGSLGQFTITSRNGIIRTVRVYRKVVTDAQEKKYFCDFVDIAPVNSASLEELDSLTGLDNMMSFLIRVSDVIASGEPKKLDNYALVYFDLDNFKLFNRDYGFERGSSLLIYIGDLLREFFSDCPVSRFSDDHFAALVPSEGLMSRIESVHDAAASFEQNARIELKAGIYYFGEGGITASNACDNARFACNGIKDKFDTFVAVYTEDIRKALNHKRYTAEHLDEAIEKRYLKVYYQPVIRVTTGKICGFEALSRWIDPVLGFLSPAEFIPALEQYRLIYRLDLYVLRMICEHYSLLREKGRPVVPVSLNLSRIDFEVCDIVSEVEAIVNAYGLPKSVIHIEITESAIGHDQFLLDKAINEFRSRGYSLWMDDFGSGYSSLNILKDYDFSVIKFDMKFLQDFSQPQRAEKSKVILRSAVSMAKRLNVQTLTEGVENQEHLDFLKTIGCEKAQGYLFSKPLPFADLEKLNYSYESETEAEYMDNLGRVNIVNQFALDHIDKSYADVKAMAVVERTSGGIFRYLQYNGAFFEFLKNLGYNSASGSEDFLNHGKGAQHKILIDLVEHCYQSHREESADYVSNGDYCNLRVRFIAENKLNHDCMFLLIAENLSIYSEKLRSESFDRGLRALLGIFERVDVLDISSGVVESTFYGAVKDNLQLEKRSIEEAKHLFTSTCLDENDVSKFDKFLTNATVRRVRDKVKRPLYADVFRTRSSNGQWRRKVYLQIPYEVDERNLVLLCRTDAEIFYKLQSSYTSSAKDSKLQPYLLWKALLEMDEFSVFWKDRSLRFAGLSRSLLNDLEIKNGNELLGHTSDELCWSSSNADREQEELRVLSEGRYIHYDVQTVANGVAKNFAVSEGPVYLDGNIIGIVGLVKKKVDDVGVGLSFDSVKKEKGNSGILGLGGLQQVLTRFENGYINNRIDFVMLKFGCLNLDTFKEANGEIYTREAESIFFEGVLDALSNKGLVARTATFSGVILKQVGMSDDLAELRRIVLRSSSDIRDRFGHYEVLKMRILGYRFSDDEGARNIRKLFEYR